LAPQYRPQPSPPQRSRKKLARTQRFLTSAGPCTRPPPPPPPAEDSLCLVGSLYQRWPDLINFLLLMVEEAGEVFQGPLVENSLCLVVCSSDDISYCSQCCRLHLHLPTTMQQHFKGLCHSSFTILMDDSSLNESLTIPNVFVSIRFGDLDPDPEDPHLFGPPGSGSRSISQRYGSGSGSFPFLIDVLSGLKECLQKRIIPQILAKKIFRLKTMCLLAIYNIKEKLFLASLKIRRWSRVRIRIKMSRISNNGSYGERRP
jgi:hypothetical protein